MRGVVVIFEHGGDRCTDRHVDQWIADEVAHDTHAIGLRQFDQRNRVFSAKARLLADANESPAARGGSR